MFATFTISEFKRCKFIDYLDCIGLNFYPCLTTIGWTEKLSNMVDKMFIDCNGSHYLKYFDKIKQTFNNKELWITEIGCFDSNENLLKPFDWNAHGELQNGNAQSKFYNAVLESLCLVDFIDGLFFWENGSTGYSPFHSARNGKCIEILKQYWSDKNE